MNELEQLQRQRDEIGARIEQILAEKKASIIDDIKKLIADYKLMPDDLFPKSKLASTYTISTTKVKNKRQAKLKYTHPQDPALTWNGLGATPGWAKALRDNEVDLTTIRQPA